MPSYFTAELFDFLKRLKRNNNRDWFLRHKDEYDRQVRLPALRFIADFAGPLFEISPYLVSDPRSSRGSLFRIYRDTRFSHDKRPYKTHLAMRFSHAGRDVHSPGFYLHFEPGGCFAAAGLWHPEPPVLLRVRTAIVARAAEWRKVHGLLNWDDANKLSRPPRGFAPDHEFVADLKLKDLGTSVDFSDPQVCSPRFMQVFAGACRTMAPLARFLSGALGLKFRSCSGRRPSAR
ncbi:MAG: TIGR02453 family protein [Acidobacteriia bacterium]|nr:TIGR02453 family protein [Terriglobia bacterium]